MRSMIGLVALLVLWTGPAPAWAATAAPNSGASPKVSAMDGALFYQLMLGELNARDGDPANAYALLMDAARKTGDVRLYHRATDIALNARAGDSALQAARAWRDAAPQSPEAARQVLVILLALNRVDASAEALLRHLALAPDRLAAINELPALYARVSDASAAADIVARALKADLADPQRGATAWAVLARLRQRAGLPQRAIEALDQAIARDAHQPQAFEAALVLLSQGEHSVVAQLQTMVQGAPVAWRVALTRALLDARLLPAALDVATTLTHDQPDLAQGWLLLGALHMDQGQTQAAEDALTRATQTQDHAAGDDQAARSRAQAQMLLAQLAVQRKDVAAAEAWLAQVTHPQEHTRAVGRRAVLMAQRGAVDEALTLVTTELTNSGTDPRTLLNTQVEVHRAARQWRQAAALIESALTNNPDDPDWLYDLAMVRDKLGDWDGMEQALRAVMRLRPQDAQAYNALGYSLAERNVRLTEAHALILQAVERAPDDAYIQDSLGWVQFRMGQHNEALKVLRAALSARADAEIATHLGEVLWHTQQPDAARQVWREAQRLNADNDTLRETLHRLGVTL